MVGILGASGFIGSRLVEICHLRGLARVRPVVRTPAHLARLSRFALDGRVADGFDAGALEVALAGCDVVVHTIAGDRGTILGTLDPVHTAAQRAGVRRLVYLSSAAVHGPAPPPGTDERSPLSTRQPLPYGTSKVLAERRLQELRRRGTLELVILRPGIVYGPRSFWTGGLADRLLAGRACLIGSGRGICNAIYVDNLVHAIHLAMRAPDVDGEAFLVGDRELVTWRALYQPLAEALGMRIEQVADIEDPQAFPAREPSAGVRLARRWAGYALPWLPRPARRRLRALYAALRAPEEASPWIRPPIPGPLITTEALLLQRCRHKLPWRKAEIGLGYQPLVSFHEGCRRSVAWLNFAGYPVVDPCS